ncbi:MAG: hypothetical protein JXA46_11035 [Dehalococcoidales bacterium]|nr:hypothetical protein [Dehalococcoidales bacterium]
MLRKLIFLFVIVFLISSLLAGGCSKKADDDGKPGGETPVITTRGASGTITTGTPVKVLAEEITDQGAVLVVDKAGDPLDGFVLDIPTGAYARVPVKIPENHFAIQPEVKDLVSLLQRFTDLEMTFNGTHTFRVWTKGQGESSISRKEGMNIPWAGASGPITIRWNGTSFTGKYVHLDPDTRGRIDEISGTVLTDGTVLEK